MVRKDDCTPLTAHLLAMELTNGMSWNFSVLGSKVKVTVSNFFPSGTFHLILVLDLDVFRVLELRGRITSFEVCSKRPVFWAFPCWLRFTLHFYVNVDGCDLSVLLCWVTVQPFPFVPSRPDWVEAGQPPGGATFGSACPVEGPLGPRESNSASISSVEGDGDS